MIHAHEGTTSKRETVVTIIALTPHNSTHYFTCRQLHRSSNPLVTFGSKLCDFDKLRYVTTSCLIFTQYHHKDQGRCPPLDCEALFIILPISKFVDKLDSFFHFGQPIEKGRVSERMFYSCHNHKWWVYEDLKSQRLPYK